VAILEPDEAIAARRREHAVAQALRLNTAAAHAVRRAALVAAASATTDASSVPGASGAGSASGALVFASRGPRRFESALSGSLASRASCRLRAPLDFDLHTLGDSPRVPPSGMRCHAQDGDADQPCL